MVREFATGLLEQFHLSKSETNAGVIVYSSEPRLVIKLNEIYEIEKFKKELKDRTPYPKNYRKRLPWMRSKTNIDKALTLAKDELFTSTNGDRRDVRNVLVFLTDGMQDPKLEPGKFLEDFSQPLKDDGATIIAVGFKKADRKELAKIASSPELVLDNTGGVEVLTRAVNDIVEKICNCKYFPLRQDPYQMTICNYTRPILPFSSVQGKIEQLKPDLLLLPLA